LFFAGVGCNILVCSSRPDPINWEGIIDFSHSTKSRFWFNHVSIVIVILMFNSLSELLLELMHVSFEFVEHWLDNIRMPTHIQTPATSIQAGRNYPPSDRDHNR
jgi:hypothetical protein